MITKTFIIIIYAAVWLLAHSTYAQDNNDAMLYAKKAESALETKRTGATITILGAMALVTGAIIVNNSLNSGAPVATAGLVTTAIGLPIWIVGSHNHKKYTKKAQRLNVKFNASPKQPTLALTYRF